MKIHQEKEEARREKSKKLTRFELRIARLKMEQVSFGSRIIRKGRNERAIRGEKGKSGGGDLASGVNDGRNKRAEGKEALKAGDAEGGFVPDEATGQTVDGLTKLGGAGFGQRGRSGAGAGLREAGMESGTGPNLLNAIKTMPVLKGSDKSSG